MYDVTVKVCNFAVFGKSTTCSAPLLSSRVSQSGQRGRCTATCLKPLPPLQREPGVASQCCPLPDALFTFLCTTGAPQQPHAAAQDIDGRDLKLSKYAGKVVLVCNVASQCGFTPQYEGLAELYDKYSKKGFVVLGAPCNQFGSQEPGTEAEIKKFAKARGAKFPLLAKLDVNGSNESPLYSFLKSEKGGILTSDVKWCGSAHRALPHHAVRSKGCFAVALQYDVLPCRNFTKFLVDREGNVVGRYFSTTEPADIEKDIEKYL